MPGYVIVDNDVTAPDAYAEFQSRIAATVEAHGGRYLVRGGDAEAVEGDWTPHRIVVVEFDSVDAAKAWLGSSDYAELRDLRAQSARANLIVVDGV